jgi:ligand-binding sensor domain-containing protein
MLHRGNKFETLAATTGLSRSPVLAIAEMPNGDIWVGTRDAGLYRLHGGRIDAVTDGLPDLKVNCLLPTEHGELWVGTDRGIVRWNEAELTRSGVPPSLGDTQALALTRDRDANIWVGTNSHGLLRLLDFLLKQKGRYESSFFLPSPTWRADMGLSMITAFFTAARSLSSIGRGRLAAARCATP